MISRRQFLAGLGAGALISRPGGHAMTDRNTERPNILWITGEDGYVEVPELPGCMAHGQSQELALKEVLILTQVPIDSSFLVEAIPFHGVSSIHEERYPCQETGDT